MRLKKVALQNVRSFAEKQELVVDSKLTVLIGPNGGGKTNLLDAVVVVLRRHLFTSTFAAHNPTPENPNRYVFQGNDAINSMRLEKHSKFPEMEQIIDVEIEVTAPDVANMRDMNTNAASMQERHGRDFLNLDIAAASAWDLSQINPGRTFSYRLLNGGLSDVERSDSSNYFRQYLSIFDRYNFVKDLDGNAHLPMPMIYLPVNRTNSSLPAAVELHSLC